MYSKVPIIVLLLCGSVLVSLTSCSKLHRQIREESSNMTIHDLLADLFDSILSDKEKNTTVTSTSFPSTYKWLTKLTSKTSNSSHPSPASTSSSKTPTSSVKITSTTVTTTKPAPVVNITTVSTTQRPTTTTMEDLRCTTKRPLEGICDVVLPDLLQDLAMKDIYQVIFATDVITSLMYDCMSGHWCLNDRFDYWNGLMMEKAVMVKDSKVFEQICSDIAHTCLQTFLNNITGCIIQERMNFTVQAIDLLCDIRQDKSLDLVCYAHTLAALHVTVVEYLRDENNKVLRKLSLLGKCNSPEVLMSKSELCVENKCPNHRNNFLSFSPWKWFTKDIEKYKTDCNFTEDTCDDKVKFKVVLNKTTTQPKTTGKTTTSHKSLAIGAANDVTEDAAESFPAKLTMILGVAAGGIIAFSGLFVLIYACWRKHGTISRADKIGYTPLRNQD